jgi:signal transduction histidine kinase
MKYASALIRIGAALIGAIAVDYLATWPYIMTPLYAIPMLIAAYSLPPRSVGAIAILVTLINLASGLLEGTPLEVVLLYTSGLLFSAYLAISLAWQRQETVRHARMAEQNAHATALAHQRLQQFLSMVTHDLRNPLAAILGTILLLSRRSAQIAPARQQKMLLSIEAAAKDMRQLVDDLRDAGTIGTDHFALRKSTVDLVEVARRVIDRHHPISAGHRLALEAPERLEGIWDAGRISQLLANLVSNAIKYSPDGGQVRIAIGCHAGEACVRVSDQGIGMHPDQVERLFQPFTRLYQGQEIQGLGLGLYISKAIVEAHGGRIWAESQPGQGSTFIAVLPLPARLGANQNQNAVSIADTA